MKRLYCLIVLSLLCGRLSAQHLHSFDFRDASLAAVLDTLAAVQDEYSISFIHNELEHLRISARIKNQTIKRRAASRSSCSINQKRISRTRPFR